MSLKKEIASLFLSSRIHNTSISAIPSYLHNLISGYELQQEIIDLNEKNQSLGTFCGWKVGATNPNAQKMMGFGPFYGPLFQSHVHTTNISPQHKDNKSIASSGTPVKLSQLGSVFKAIEIEIAIKLKDDLPSLSSSSPSSNLERKSTLLKIFGQLLIALFLLLNLHHQDINQIFN